MDLLHSPPKVEHDDFITVITFTGERDSLASELEGQTDDLGESHVLLDFINVDWITGVDLGTLISLENKIRTAGGRLKLVNLNDHVLEVLSITKLHELFDIL